MGWPFKLGGYDREGLYCVCGACNDCYQRRADSLKAKELRRMREKDIAGMEEARRKQQEQAEAREREALHARLVDRITSAMNPGRQGRLFPRTLQ